MEASMDIIKEVNYWAHNPLLLQYSSNKGVQNQLLVPKNLSIGKGRDPIWIGTQKLPF